MLGLSLQKSVLISSFLLGTSLWAQGTLAAPICRGLFAPLSQGAKHETQEESVESLARLRLRLDMEKSRGNKSSIISRMESHYLEKFQSLAQALYLDRAMLNEKIRELVPVIQARDRRDHEKQREDKATEKIDLNAFEFGETFNIDKMKLKPQHLPDFILYFADSNSILTVNPGREMRLLSLATKQSQLVAKGVVAAMTTPDGQSFVTLDKRGLLRTYDRKSLQEISATPLDLGKGIHLATSLRNDVDSVDLSPGGDKIAIAFKRKEIFIFDLKNGNLITAHKSTSPNPDSDLIRVKFHSDSEVIYAHTSNLVKFDANTGTVMADNNQPRGFFVSYLSVVPSSDLVIMGADTQFHPEKALIYDAGSLARSNEVPDMGISDITQVPGRSELMAVTASQSFTTGIYRRSSLDKPIFNFDLKYDSRVESYAQRIVFSEEGNAVLVFYHLKMVVGVSPELKVDVWKKLR